MSEEHVEFDPEEGCSCLGYFLILFVVTTLALIGFYDLGRAVLGSLILVIVTFVILPLVGVVPVIGQLIYSGVAHSVIFWAFGLLQINPYIHLNVPGWVNFVVKWIVEEDELEGTLASFAFAVGYVQCVLVSIAVLLRLILPRIEPVFNWPTPAMVATLIGLFLVAIGFLRWTGSNQPPPIERPTDKSFAVQATADWQDAGFYVEQGETVAILYTAGRWNDCAANHCPDTDANGVTNSPPNDSTNLLPGCPHLALIGRVAGEAPFCIRRGWVGPLAHSGPVQLRANDSGVNDNGGSITVQLTIATTQNRPLPGSPADWVAPGDPPYYIYFPQTHHNLGGGFKAFWQANDGLRFFGYPLTEEFQEGGRTVQYFERARLELLPSAAGQTHIGLGLLGRELTTGQKFDTVSSFPTNDTHTYFAATQHSLNFGFYQFWRDHDGLNRFGYPISEEFKMGSITVQYFERARLEYHPEITTPDQQTTLGLLGVELLRARHWLP